MSCGPNRATPIDSGFGHEVKSPESGDAACSAGPRLVMGAILITMSAAGETADGAGLFVSPR